MKAKHHIIRDSVDGLCFLAQGLCLQRVRKPEAETMRDPLTWAKEVASSGGRVMPIGFIADIGHMIFGEELEARLGGRDENPLPNMQQHINLIRTYEDHVLGKIWADWTFTRASDALRHYKTARDKARGLAYFLNQFHEKAQQSDRDKKPFGVEMPVGIIASAMEVPPKELLVEGWESLRQEGPHPLLLELYADLINACGRTGDALEAADIWDLEHKTALQDLSERLANRQVIKAGGILEATLPKHKVRPLARRMEVPTRILDEDMYPIGGFTSISNRGSIESLLHSQLAYMETDASEAPDLFDTMFLMDELLYYSRDDNQFLRRRRTFVLALSEDLVETRFKDFELPYQRGVMLMGLVYVLVRKIVEWLSTDALDFQILFPGAAGDLEPLATERAILGKLFMEEIAQDTVHLGQYVPSKLAKACEDWSRRTMCHVLMIGVRPERVEAKEVDITRLAINSPRPELGDGVEDLFPVEGEDAQESWSNALQGILMRWI